MDKSTPMIAFDMPWIWLLLPLPYLLYRWLTPVSAVSSALRVPFFNRIQTLDPINDTSNQPIYKRSLWVPALIWLLLLLAASAPAWMGDAQSAPLTSRDVMLAVDISGSMQIEDLTLNDRKANRLQVIKHIIGDFILKRQGDRLGLILFGSNAYLQAPLTFDLQTVGTLLNEAQIGMAGERTAIGDALGLAIKRLINAPEAQRVVVLLSDGGDNASEVPPIQAAQLAAKEHVKIYTVGVGADEMIEQNFFGVRRINPSQDLDETALKAIASSTGGEYFRAKNTEELANIYTLINNMEPTSKSDIVYRPHQALFYYPLALALALSLLLAIRKIMQRMPL